jgi:hypothetical protein
MIDTTFKPLRPPLAAPDPKLPEEHLNRRLPIANGKPAAGKGSPGAPPRATPRAGVQPQPQSPRPLPASCRGATPPALASSPGRDAVARPKRLTCRECRTKTLWPAAGWYSLDRRIVPGSVPPEVLNEAERRSWARLNRQWMGIFCSMTCLGRSMKRLQALDCTFREKGVGTRLAGPQPAVKAASSQQPTGGRR